MREHSNVHIGEMQWGTDPTDSRSDERPDRTLRVEMDFYEAADTEDINTTEWERGVENNYALYDIQVNIIRDETLSEADFATCLPLVLQPYCVDTSNGFGYEEIAGIASSNSDESADEYVFVTDTAGGAIPGGPDQSGINLYGVPYQALFTDGLNAAEIPAGDVQRSPYDSDLAMYAAKTQIHELGHSFAAGEGDDRSLSEDPVRKFYIDGEVYSGTSADNTPERLQPGGSIQWSLMASGWERDLTNYPMHGRYFAYSIEEASTMEDA
jgi:hypothetical protein